MQGTCDQTAKFDIVARAYYTDEWISSLREIRRAPPKRGLTRSPSGELQTNNTSTYVIWRIKRRRDTEVQ